ncbi:alpha-D-xyloside xylohydrolase protein [Dioscorea alata]|uniref:Alpha-D-xyloside xylohydrolase protein n=1 Tax=Dioscorea alata TaxID=55571 RepID=A0ACB7W588_DIOAL|nr:alpha-D-xyloside xylohydrolase protein [Dioscorea alata]
MKVNKLKLSMLCLCFLLFMSFQHCASAGNQKIGSGYRLVSLEENSNGGGLLGKLELKQKTSVYGPDVPHLCLFVKHESEDRLRVHLTDASEERWEVPYNLLPREQPPTVKGSTTTTTCVPFTATEYSGDELLFSYKADPFSFSVKRKSNGDVLFDSTAKDDDPYSSLVFKDQYLEISTRLPETAALYGLGENTQPGGIRLRPNDPYTLYTTDASAINLNMDLYGSHPVYMDLRNANGEANAHAVLLLNSNGMDIVYRGSSLTYKVIGGVFDFYFFKGPTPLAVVDQYTTLIGRPAPMPYWALGFHQCRWGYRNLSVVEGVVEGYKKAQIPLDVIWNDDDHMDAAKDFTLDPVNYPRPKLLAFLDKIHSQGMKYIVLIDPGIAVNSSYGVYQRGMAKDVYIKYQGKPYLAQVWPGPVYFPDYLNPQGVSWWVDEIARFHELVPVDGLWIDMNEASNFCTGKCELPKDHPCPIPNSSEPWVCCLDCKNITSTRWDEPPYKINASGAHVALGFKTIATSAEHYNGVLEYNAHSIYGFSQAVATHKALLGLEGKRPFILTRSTFVGSGAYAAHWTGDNKGTWNDIRYSISTILNFGLFGMPMVGSDICGFYPAPTEELCNRWIQLGAFYPFSRDHANYYSPRQELYVWDSVAKSARNALGLRYKLLPYLYTLNYEAHTRGAPIARPVFFSFPNFTACYGLSTQFLLGSSVMVSPVLKKAARSVKVIFPPGTWYNLFDMTKAVFSKDERYITLDAPLNEINVHVYQNTILPMQQGGLISKEARKTPFTLVVTFPLGATQADAKGNVFVDEDERPEMKLVDGESSYVEFYASIRGKTVTVWSEVQMGSFSVEKQLMIENVIVLGLQGSGHGLAIEVDGEAVTDVYGVHFSDPAQMNMEKLEGGNKKNSMMVEIGGLGLPLGKKFSISWKMGIKG